MKRDTVLILTNSKDGEHTDSVIRKLQEKGCKKIFRLNVDKLSRGEVNLKFAVDNGMPWSFEFVDGTTKITSNEVKSVWYRRPNRYDFDIQNTDQKKFSENELRTLLDGLWFGLAENVRWISHPKALEFARKKITQLKIAQELGIRVPRTLVSNNPDEVRSFHESINEGIIFKPIDVGFITSDVQSYSIYTSKIGSKELERVDLVQKLPSLFQENIKKQYELRITVVGKHIFPVKISSQEFSATETDWRPSEYVEKLNHTVVSLPKNIEKFCFNMLDKLGLRFGAFDFAVTPDNQYVFFEVNPNGQWYWIEMMTGADISSAIAEELII